MSDSILIFTYRFESTSASVYPPLTGSDARPPGSDSGEAVFKLKNIDWDARLVLDKIGEAARPWGKPVLELVKSR